MNHALTSILLATATLLCAQAQTVFVPAGTGGIGSSPNAFVGVGTNAPRQQLDVQGGYLVTSDTSGGPAAFMEGGVNTAYFGAIDGRPAAFGNRENWYTVVADGGNVGIGQNPPLETRLAVMAQYPTLAATGTNYYKAVDLNAYLLPIPAGVTENGYRIGLGVQSYVQDAAFQGTLATQMAVWARHGANQSGAGSRIVNSYGVYVESMTTANTTIDNLYGVFQTGATARNYFEGRVGVGTTVPALALEVSARTGVPASSGTAQNGRFRLSGGHNGVTDFGMLPEAPFSSWIQSTDKTDLGYPYPLALNPVGGNVGIGTLTPSHKLSVNGAVRAKEVIVDTGWSDYVFADDYRLTPLSEVEQHIKAEKHLPGIPSAAEVAKDGISVGDMQAKLLAKIEELTLHQIALEKTQSALSGVVAAQAARIKELEADRAHAATTK